MSPGYLRQKQMELQAKLNSQRSVTTPNPVVGAGQHTHIVPQSQLGADIAIQYLPHNSFVLRGNQAGLFSAFQQPLAIVNGQSVLQGRSQGTNFPLSHDSSQLVVMNAADLSRLLNPPIASASPIVILPSIQSIPLPLAYPQDIPHQPIIMPHGSFIHQHLGHPTFLPTTIDQVIVANRSRNESTIPGETASAYSIVQQQGQTPLAPKVGTTLNPLELLAAASNIPNNRQVDHSPSGTLGLSSSLPPSTPDSYREEKGSNSNNPKPKRPLSAYNIFFRDERAKIIAGELSDEEKDMLQRGSRFEDRHTSSGIKEYRRKQPHRKASFQDLARIIAARWKTIDPERLQKYEKMSALGRIKYSRDLHIWAQRERKDVVKPIQRLVERNMEKAAQNNV